MCPDGASSDNGTRRHSEPATIQRVLVVGYILAVAVPPVGFAIGRALMLSARRRSRHAAWIVLLSIVAAAIWLALINAGALKQTGQGY